MVLPLLVEKFKPDTLHFRSAFASLLLLKFIPEIIRPRNLLLLKIFHKSCLRYLYFLVRNDRLRNLNSSSNTIAFCLTLIEFLNDERAVLTVHFKRAEI